MYVIRGVYINLVVYRQVVLNRNKGSKQRQGTPLYLNGRALTSVDMVVGGLLSSAEFRLCEVEYKCALLILRGFN